jgi:hypothetical protein
VGDLQIDVPDEPAVIVATGRGEVFWFTDNPDRPRPKMTGLGAAVLVTRLRWWADWIEANAADETPDFLR